MTKTTFRDNIQDDVRVDVQGNDAPDNVTGGTTHRGGPTGRWARGRKPGRKPAHKSARNRPHLATVALAAADRSPICGRRRLVIDPAHDPVLMFRCLA